MMTLPVSLSPPLNGDDRDDAFCGDDHGDGALFQSMIPLQSKLQALLRLWRLRVRCRSSVPLSLKSLSKTLRFPKLQMLLELNKSQQELQSWLHVSSSPPLNGDDRDDAFCDDDRGDDASFQSMIRFPSRLQALLRLWTLRVQGRSWVQLKLKDLWKTLRLLRLRMPPELNTSQPELQSWREPALCTLTL